MGPHQEPQSLNTCLRASRRTVEWVLCRRVTISVAFAAILLTLISIHPGYFILGGDEQLTELAPQISWLHRWPLYDLSAGLGKDGSLWRPILFPFTIVDLILEKLGVSALLVNYFWLAFIEAIQAVAIFDLQKTLFPECDRLPYALFCGVFAVANPYNLLNFHTPFPTTALAIATFPGLIAAALSFSRTGHRNHFIRFFLYAVLNSCATFNLAIALTEISIFASFVFLLALWYRNAWKRPLALALVMTGLYSLWLPAALRFTTSQLAQLISSTEAYSETTMRVTSEFSKPSNSLRLVGDYLFFNRAGPNLYLPDGPSYQTSALIVLATSLVPLLALASVASAWVLSKRSRTTIFAIATVTGGALFLAKGAAEPAGNIFLWLFAHISVFHAFRDPFNKLEWIVVIGYSLLATKCLETIASRRIAGPASSSVVVSAALGVVAIAAFPIFQGHFFFEKAYIKIPARYFDAAAWLNKQQVHGRLLVLPVATNLFDTYRWGYVGAGLLPSLVARPVVGRLHDFGSPGTAALDDIAQNYKTTIGSRHFAPLLGLFGVRYVASDSAIDPAFFAPLYADEMQSAAPGMRRVWSEGSLAIYQINSRLVSPLFYPATRLEGYQPSLVDTSISCAVLSSCQSIAFAPRDERIAGLPKPSTSTAHAQQFVQRQLTFSPSISNLTVSPGKSMVVDFANASFAREAGPASTSEIEGLVAGGKPPVRAVIGEKGRGAGNGTDFIVASRVRDKTLCASARSTSDYEVTIPSRPLRGTKALLLLRYSSDNVGVELQLSAERGKQLTSIPSYYYFAPLSAQAGQYTFSRIVAFPNDVKEIRLQFFVTAGLQASCATLESAVLARAVSPREWSLRGSALTLSATPLYVAKGEDVASRIANSIFAVNAHAIKVSRDSRFATDTPGGWVPLDHPVEYLRDRPLAVGEISDVDVERGTARISALGGAFDVHAFFGHLIPGFSYELSFRVKEASVPFRVAILQETGNASLVSEDVAPGERIVSLHCTVPPDTSSVRLYVYFNETGPQTGRVILTKPSISLLQSQEVATVPKPDRLEVPAAFSQAGNIVDGFDFMAARVPAEWLLVADTSYDDKWLLDPADPSISARHIRVNLFQNGWLIRGREGSVQHFRLSYQRQRAWFGDVAIAFVQIAGAGLLVFRTRST